MAVPATTTRERGWRREIAVMVVVLVYEAVHVQVSKVATYETQFHPALYGPSQATAKLGRWASLLYIVNYIPV